METAQNKALVAIKCYTYNHESYIRNALEGFIMQKTTFPFVAIIHDDASTDGTATIIREYAEKYPNIIRPIFETENQYSKHDGSLRRIVNEACVSTGAKYIALCEGDDYWTDPLKLQKQIDLLEKHPDYSACLTSFISYNEVQKKPYALIGNDYLSLRDMLWRDLQFGTATLVMRSSLYFKYLKDIHPENKRWLMGDKPLVLYLASQGRVKTLNDCTTVYRILQTSASHSTNIELQLKRARNTIDIYHFYAEKFIGEDPQLKKKIEGGFLYRAFLIYKENGLSVPKELKKKICDYNGRYYKLHIVKVLIHFPFLQRVAYKAAEIKNRLLVNKKIK